MKRGSFHKINCFSRVNKRDSANVALPHDTDMADKQGQAALQRP